MNADKRMQQEQYKKMVERASPNSEMTVSMLKAFAVGGLICMVGQALTDIGLNVLGLDELHARMFCSIILVFLGSTLTGLGVYDRIGKFAGAGSIVPITGFANSVVAPAMEFKREGMITGVAAKMFTIAGPVIAYGTIVSILVGLIYYFFGGVMRLGA